MVPSSNNKYELGTLGLRWKNINVVNANISGNVTSRRTVAGDPPEALVTKSYIDELSFELALVEDRRCKHLTKVFAKRRSQTKVRQRLAQTLTPGLKVTSPTFTQVT